MIAVASRSKIATAPGAPPTDAALLADYVRTRNPRTLDRVVRSCMSSMRKHALGLPGVNRHNVDDVISESVVRLMNMKSFDDDGRSAQAFINTLVTRTAHNFTTRSEHHESIDAEDAASRIRDAAVDSWDASGSMTPEEAYSNAEIIATLPEAEREGAMAYLTLIPSGWADADSVQEKPLPTEKSRLSPTQIKILDVMVETARIGILLDARGVAEKLGSTRGGVGRHMTEMKRRGWLDKAGNILVDLDSYQTAADRAAGETVSPVKECQQVLRFVDGRGHGVTRDSSTGVALGGAVGGPDETPATTTTLGDHGHGATGDPSTGSLLPHETPVIIEGLTLGASRVLRATIALAHEGVKATRDAVRDRVVRDTGQRYADISRLRARLRVGGWIDARGAVLRTPDGSPPPTVSARTFRIPKQIDLPFFATRAKWDSDDPLKPQPVSPNPRPLTRWSDERAHAHA